MVSVASLALSSAFKGCAEDKETVSGLYVSEKYIINLVLALPCTLAVIKRHKTTYLYLFILINQIQQ